MAYTHRAARLADGVAEAASFAGAEVKGHGLVTLRAAALGLVEGTDVAARHAVLVGIHTRCHHCHCESSGKGWPSSHQRQSQRHPGRAATSTVGVHILSRCVVGCRRHHAQIQVRMVGALGHHRADKAGTQRKEAEHGSSKALRSKRYKLSRCKCLIQQHERVGLLCVLRGFSGPCRVQHAQLCSVASGVLQQLGRVRPNSFPPHSYPVLALASLPSPCYNDSGKTA